MSAPPPSWFDPSRSGSEDCVLSCLLERQAREQPGATAFVFEDGGFWTWAETLHITRATAAALAGLGVACDDKVIGWLPNGRAALRTWFATNYLGAIFVPINTAYKGGLLEHAVNLCEARVMVAHGDLAERLADIKAAHLDTVIICSAEMPQLADYTLLTETMLDGDPDMVGPAAQRQPSDPQVIIFTSGTTGPSKGVLSPYLQTATTGRLNYGYMTRDDRILVNLPIFHVGGITPVMAALFSGGSSAMVDGFSTNRFLEVIRTTGSTTCAGFVGVMASFLLSREPKSDDADNPLRMMILSPLNQQAIDASKRFGFDYCSGFNMTETSTPLITEVNATTHTSLGTERAGAECRIVDTDGNDCRAGEIGELLVRTDNRYEMNIEYYGMPEATKEAWAGGWFHTGDLVRCNDDGEYFFVDRLKDAIRRRGENISSLEVEAEVYAFDNVNEAAVLAVASPYGEEEVLVVVSAKAGRSLKPRPLIKHLIERLPYFMVPRYVRILKRLPKTATNKIQKVELRKEGLTPDTWDREAAGIVLKRENLKGY